MKKTKLSLSITNMHFEQSADRTNWMTFKGTCMFVDKPSDYTPSGGDKPVQFSREETQKALPTFVGMGVNCKFSDWDTGQLFEGHDSQFKIGVVKAGEIVGNEVQINGGLWSWDFAELCDKIKSAKDSLGWSIEPLMYLEDKGDYYEATDIEFLGVALMWADKAAFADTYMFSKKINKGGISMDKTELQAMLAEFSAGINKTINDNIEGVKAEFSAQIEVVSKVVTDFQAELVAEKEALKLQAEKDAAEAEEKAKLALEAQQAEEAEKAKLALEAKEKAENEAAQRKTMMFGTPLKRFEGETDAQKAIMENKDLDAGAQFRALIDLKLQQAK